MFLLLHNSPAYCLTKHIGVYLGGCGSASHEWHMLVITWTFLVEFPEKELTACHEPCGFLDQAHFSSSVLDVGCHAELTHMSLSNSDRWMPQKLTHTWKLP